MKAGRLPPSRAHARQWPRRMPLACFWNCAADSESAALETTLVSAPAELRHNRPQLLSGRGESAAALAQILRGPMRPLRLGVAHRDSDTAIY